MGEDWSSVTLAEICEKPQYGAIASGSDVPVGPLFVRQTDIVSGEIDWASVPFAAVEDRDRSKYSLSIGDLLISRLGAGVGTAARVRQDRGAIFAGYLVRFRVRTGLADSAFVGHALHSSAWAEHVARVRSGAAQPTLNAQQMGEFRVFLPSLQEQRRIAGVLGAFDDLIDNLHESRAQLDELARSAFLARWDVTTRSRLSDIGEVTMGQSPPGSTYNEAGDGLPFYQGVRDFGDRYPTERVYCSAPTRVAEAGDILIAVRAPIGSTNVATSTTAIGRGLAALRATRPSTALHAIRSDPSLWSPYEGEGTVFSSINGPTLRSVEVPWVDDPDLESQLRVLDELHRSCAEDAERLARARDELLPLLMSGRMTVDEALEAVS